MKLQGPAYETGEKIRAKHAEMKTYYQETPAWVVREGHAEKYIVDHIQAKDSSILDIGASGGVFLKGLRNQGYTNLTAVDIDNYLQDDVKASFSFIAVDLNYTAFPIPDTSYDVVTCLSVMEHLENPFHLAREVSRILKPGGIFIMSIPNAFHLWSKISFLLHGELTDWREENAHITFLTKAVFKKSYLQFFKIEKEIYQNGFLPYFPKVKMPRNELFGRRVCYFLRKIG
jgi:2-polyprenyl-3-methyl-5-hydroxy-6-metoxy-1,4-benzoquinol methylase